MSEIINNLLALANEEAEYGVDMNEAVKGGGGGRLLPAGYAYAQLVELVELGKQPQEFGGKPKEPALEIQLGFALTGFAQDPAFPDDHTKVLPYANEDGTPYIVRPWPFAISQNEKARAFLLFKALNWKRTAKNFAQLLSQKYLVKIVHEPKSKTDPKIVSRMDLKSFLPPLNPVGNIPYPIPDADPSLYKLFLWNRPTFAAWESLKIEGTFEQEVNGVKTTKSKNRTQETILAALDFQGSPLQQLLAGSVAVLPGAVQPAQAVVPAPAVQPVAVAPAAVQVAAVAPAAVPAVAPVQPAQAAIPVTPVVTPAAVPTPAAVAPVAAAPAPVAVAPVVAAVPVLPV